MKLTLGKKINVDSTYHLDDRLDEQLQNILCVDLHLQLQSILCNNIFAHLVYI